MTTLTDEILSGRSEPTLAFLKDYTITGGSEQVEERLKALGWDGKTPVASVGIHIEDGMISDMQVFVFGNYDGGHISARMLWGDDKFDSLSYVKLEQVDLALACVRGRLVSSWMKGDKLDWMLKIHNIESGKYRTVQKLDEDGLVDKGASKLNFRLHLSLEKGPSLKALLGVAPMGNVTDLIGSGSMNFPMMKTGKDVELALLPSEPRGSELGLGFVPFFIDTSTDGQVVFPSFSVVRTAVCDLFNTACKPKLHKKALTWKQSVDLGFWTVVDPSFTWPDPSVLVDEPEEEGECLGCAISGLAIIRYISFEYIV
jgi:hypothetical protein